MMLSIVGYFIILKFNKDYHRNSMRIDIGMDCFSCGKNLNMDDDTISNRIPFSSGFKGSMIEAYNKKSFLTMCVSCNRDSKLSLLESKNIRFDRLKEFCLKTSRGGLMSRNKLKITAIWMTLVIIGVILALCSSPLYRPILALYNITLSIMWIIDIFSIYLVWKIYQNN